MRHSIAWPRGCNVPACTRSGWPIATRSCSRTMSTPYTSSVTGCSTWSRVERSEEHTSELQSRSDLVCRLLLEKKNGIEQSCYRKDMAFLTTCVDGGFTSM